MRKSKFDVMIVLQALIGSAALHAVYFAVTFAVGYTKTVLHQPNRVQAWKNAEMLQQEVAFGAAVTPFFFVATFIGMALICAVFLLAYKKMTSGLEHQRNE